MNSTGIDQYSNIVILGGAGLVGHNLVLQLLESGANSICVVDRHPYNSRILADLHPNVTVIVSDIADTSTWSSEVGESSAVVMLHAQIGGTDEALFEHNNVTATRKALEVLESAQVRRLIHVSSSVVESVANDWYTNSKKHQEELVAKSFPAALVLRPTLMFGWFDRKHLGWLAQFMKRIPLFPVPGSGRYMRQPLYVGDFCRVIVEGLKRPDVSGKVNITGHEKIDYIDLIRMIKRSVRARTLVIPIPVPLFALLLKMWSIFDSNPPFTADQLYALIAHDEFEVIDWPGIFGVEPVPLFEAIEQTFNHPRWSQVRLEF